jgi:HNH endonuclease
MNVFDDPDQPWPIIDTTWLCANAVKFTNTEFGIFMRLALIAWKHPIKDDDARIARMLWISPKQWQKLKPRILGLDDFGVLKWTLVDGHWHAPKDLEGQPRRWPISRRQRRQILERDNHTCQYCGARDRLRIDHITPVIRGGRSYSNNLVTACDPCNASKGDKLLHVWLRLRAKREVQQ